MKNLLLSLAAAMSVASAAQALDLKSELAAGTGLSNDYFWNEFGCTGGNASPALSWSGAPEGTKSFALTFYDKDAPTGSGFWHYVLIDIPADVTSIEAGALRDGKLPAGAVEGNTDLGKPGFFGPCPPVGRKHNYVWTIHALKVEKLEAPAGATAPLTGFFINMNSLGSAKLDLFAGPRS